MKSSNINYRFDSHYGFVTRCRVPKIFDDDRQVTGWGEVVIEVKEENGPSESFRAPEPFNFHKKGKAIFMGKNRYRISREIAYSVCPRWRRS
jgi:hypothetical protein